MAHPRWVYDDGVFCMWFGVLMSTATSGFTHIGGSAGVVQCDQMHTHDICALPPKYLSIYYVNLHRDLVLFNLKLMRQQKRPLMRYE